MRIDDIAELPEAMQLQLEAKIAMNEAKRRQAVREMKEAKQRKYRNQPTEVGGIRFDSKKESERFRELMAMQEAGAISDLRLQPEFTLIEPWTGTDGTRHRRMAYRADFSYRRDGKLVIEDVKSPATAKNPVYVAKKKQMAAMGYVITEV